MLKGVARLVRGIAVGALFLLLVAGCGPISLDDSPTPPPSPSATVKPSPTAVPKPPPVPTAPPAISPTAILPTSAPGLVPIILPTKTPEKTVTIVTLNIGDIARLKKLNFQVENISTTPGPYDHPPKPGYVYMLIYATVHNTGNETLYIYPKTMTRLVDGVNNIYERSLNAEVGAQLYDSQTQVLAGSIDPGNVVTGVWGYEVPAKDPHMVFTFSPNSGVSIVVTLGDAPARYDGTRAPVPTPLPVN